MKYIFIGNWKMNPPTYRQAKELFDATKKAAEKAKHLTVIVAPPALYMRELKSRYKGKRIALAAQYARAEDGGAHTGDISLVQAKDAGASYVIVGHAERRGQGETNDDTRMQVARALQLGMTPVLCVGESSRDASGSHFALVREQLRTGCADVEPFELKKIMIVYEPLWTIGKTEAMSPRDMHEMAIFIRKTMVEAKGEAGMQVRILYGGSVDDTNAAAMLRDGDVHGLLVGRVSEDAERTKRLLEVMEQAV